MLETIFPQVDYIPKHLVERCYFCSVLEAVDNMEKIQTDLEVKKQWVCDDCLYQYRDKHKD